jgi:hypothetical protein
LLLGLDSAVILVCWSCRTHYHILLYGCFGFRYCQEFLLLHVVQIGSGTHPASYLMGTRNISPGIKRPEFEADHSPPTSAEVKKLRMHSSTPPPILLHGVVSNWLSTWTTLLTISGSLQILRLRSKSNSELLDDWRFTVNQFVLAPSPLRTKNNHSFIQLNTWDYSPYVTSTLTGGSVCRLQLLLALAIAVILRSESRGIHGHNLLSRIQDSPNLEE